MSPIPQEFDNLSSQSLKTSETINESLLKDDSILISGMSGMYPKARNIKEFADILYKKENAIQENKGLRWQIIQPELNEYLGMTEGIDQFDAQFFTLSYFLGQQTDPMARKIIEHTFQAIYDAGLNPRHLHGKKVAVVIGSAYSNTTKEIFLKSMTSKGLSIVGTAKTMFANRVSYWLNVNGPSLSIDESDCSSTTALEQAYLAIRRGDCEAAIVAGANFCFYPQGVINHGRLGVISKDGKTKSFSEDANGYVLSDAVGVLVLQKAKDALRCYAELLHVKNEYVSSVVANNKTEHKFGYYRNPKATAKFIEDFYNEAQISPQLVEYVEGYGTGVPDADKSELEAIEEIFCKESSNSLMVGSVTSNIGLTDSASGIASITKILLGYHKGEMAANLNYEPRKDITALNDGRMRIITEHQRFDRTYAAVNGMSLTSVNSHVLFYGHYKPKNLSRYSTSMPYLITISGRHVPNVKNIFDDLKSRPIDSEEIALLHNIHSENISGYMARGYIILDTNTCKETVTYHETITHHDDKKQPLWFVYSGMGSQWAGMGTKLMRIPIFASAIERCQQVLSPFGVDVVNIITCPDKSIFDNILHSFIGIAAVQIGLTDILKALGLKPDGIIGHSVGEVGCAYADGCLTLEETILTSYSRGIVSSSTSFIPGTMAAVGLGYKQICEMCPPEIDVACRNSAQSCTISGPAEVMKQFLAHLSNKGIFAKEVPSANIAYHSRYIAHAGPKLLTCLKNVIKNPKLRSKSWISTSVPQNKWNESDSKYCSAEYHTNNLLNPVLFEEASELIPSNAVLIEVAPHGLLQAILKRSAHKNWRNIPLTKRGHRDNTLHLLQAIGNLYMEGISMNLQALYPPVQFPVSTETPMLSHHVEWFHTESWHVPSHKLVKMAEATWKFSLSVHDKEYTYLRGNVISQKMCLPFAAALVSVWDAYSMELRVPKQSVSISFKDIQLYAQPLLFDQKSFQFSVSLKRTNGWFEVRNEYSRIATGFVFENTTSKPHLQTDYEEQNKEHENMELKSSDVYQLLNDRGYNYSGEFRSIEWTNTSFSKAAIVWSNNWVTFIDGMLQLGILRQLHNAVSLPNYIRILNVDVDKQLESGMERKFIEAYRDDVHKITRCGGVTIQHIQYRNLPALIPSTSNLITSATKMDNVFKINMDEGGLFPNEESNSNVDSLHRTQLTNIFKSKLPIEVHFAGLNEFDVSKMTGSESLNGYGMDYSGITKSGDRVMGLVSSGAASLHIEAKQELLWPVPKHWSLEDAVTVPFAYTYAFYTLVIKGNLQPGISVLIHEGTDPLGQAAIAIALAYKCQVYATVSNVDKKRLLQKLFHQLSGENIGSSHDVDFLNTIIIRNQGKGFDMILSSVKGEIKNATMKYYKHESLFIDTVHIRHPEDLAMANLNLRSYVTIDFSSIFKEDNLEDMKILQQLVSDGISAGYVVPLSRVTYSLQELERGIKLMEIGQHYGRVIVRMSDNIPLTNSRLTCDPEKYQLMFWNDEVLGVQLAERLIQLGAKKLFIICSKLTSYQLFKFRLWEKTGIKVVSDKLTKELFCNENFIGSIDMTNIEGIFIIALKPEKSSETVTDLASQIDNLDSKSSLPRSHLRRFVLISAIKDLATNTYLSRIKSGLPTTWVDLSNLPNIKTITSDYIVDILQNKEGYTYVTVNIKAEDEKHVLLFEEVLSLSDIHIPQTVSTDTTLKELGIQDGMIELISKFLDINYNISLDIIELSHLTINQLHKLEEYSRDFIPIEVKGLSTFVSHIYSDEILGTAELLVLPTLSHDVISIENDYEITGQFLCIVPGIEGHHECFRDVCERLKIPALVLQPGLDHQNETIKETAQRYAKILSKKTDMQNHFYLLGYETGVMVAIELATILEDQGLTGTVFCLGFTPQEMQLELEHQLREFVTEEQLQNAVINHVYKLLLGQNSTEMDEKLQNIQSWTEKVDLCMKYILGRTNHSSEFVRRFIEAILTRIVNARHNFDAARPLRSKLVVIRAASDIDSSKIIIPPKISMQPIITHQLQFPLSCVSRDKNCSALINQYLDEDLLKEFETKNTCLHYFVNED